MKPACVISRAIAAALGCLWLGAPQVFGQDRPGSGIPLSVTVDGEAVWSIREESGPGQGLSQIPRRHFKLQMDPRFSLWGVELTGKILYSSLDDVAARARNRLILTLERGPATLTIGDGYASAAKYVTRGARIRGVSARLQTPRARVSFLHGESKRADEGMFDADNDRVVRYGTYRRELTNLNLEVTTKAGLIVAAGLADGEDDPASIDYGRSPRENRAFGADLDWVYKNNKASLGASVASSETEIRSTGANESASYDDNTAYEIRASLRIRSHRLSGSYYAKGTYYESFAAPTLTPDRKGFAVEDRFELFARKATVIAEFRRQENNVDGDAPFTLATVRPSVTVNLRQGKTMPAVRLAGSRTLTSNDAPGDSPRRVDHHLDVGQVRLSKDFPVGKTKVTPSVSYKHQRRTESARPEHEFTGTALQLGARVKSPRYTPALSLAHSKTDYDSPLRATRERVTVALTHRLQAGRRLELNGKQAYTLDERGGEALGKRAEFELGAVYALAPGKLNWSTTVKLFNFASDLNPSTEYDGFSLVMKLSTAGAMELVSRDP